MLDLPERPPEYLIQLPAVASTVARGADNVGSRDRN